MNDMIKMIDYQISNYLGDSMESFTNDLNVVHYDDIDVLMISIASEDNPDEVLVAYGQSNALADYNRLKELGETGMLSCGFMNQLINDLCDNYNTEWSAETVIKRGKVGWDKAPKAFQYSEEFKSPFNPLGGYNLPGDHERRHYDNIAKLLATM